MDQFTKESHFFDLKLPLGGLLIFYGMVLVVYGLVTAEPPSPGDVWLYERTSGMNVNLVWGIFTLAVGGVLLAFSLRKRRSSA